jgi:hypothetical protein
VVDLNPGSSKGNPRYGSFGSDVGTSAYHMGFPLCIQFMIPRRSS